LLLGVILIPAVLQPDWFIKFVKVTDLYFFIPSGAIPEWPLNMHKALTIGLYFPLLRFNLWDWSNVPFMGRLGGGTLSALYCTALTRQMEGIFFANFGQPVLGLPICHRAWCAACYQQRPGTSFLVYHGSDPETAPRPSEEKFYLQARAGGGSTCCPFECDECVFFDLLVLPVRE
jgi:hypothetical protein